MKKILIFILCLIPWSLSSLIKIDFNYYNNLHLPFFTPPPIFYSIFWSIAYIGISLSTYKILIKIKFRDLTKQYKIALLINYLLAQSFMLFFFLLKNPFIAFISCLVTFISSLFLYQETNYLNEKSTKYLDPYVLLSLFSTILSITIYVLNTL